MAVNVVIPQVSLFKKKLNVSDLIKLSQLSYGSFDENYRMQLNEVSEHTILFDEAKIARGIEMWIENYDVCLSLSLPTTWEEVENFYDLIQKICKYLNTKQFIRDEEKVSIKDIESFIEDDVKTSIQAIEEISESVVEYKHFQIMSVMNPISLGPNEFKKIDGNLNKFSDLLHHLQTIDAYYAAPKVYQKEDKSLFGLYFVGEEITTIVPTKPYVFLNRIKDVKEWYVYLKENVYISYKDFIYNVHIVDQYDDNHVIVCLSKEEIENLIQKYQTNL